METTGVALARRMAGTPMAATTITPSPTAIGHRREASSATTGTLATRAGGAGLGCGAGAATGAGATSTAPHRWQLCRSG